MKTIRLRFVDIIYFFYFWFLLPDFLRSEFPIINTLSLIFRFSGSVIAAYLLVIYRRQSKSLLILTVFIIYMLFTTLLNGFNIHNLIRWAAIYVDIFCISVFTEYLISNNASRYLSIMNYICVLGLIINAFTVFFLKEGLVQVPNEAGILFPYYFYDYDNSFVIRYIYSFAIVFLNDRSYKKNNFKWVVILATATLVYRHSVGSSLAIFAFIILYCFRNIIPRQIVNIKTAWVGYGLMTLLILFASSSGILAKFIAYYHKTVSLGKRIYMWNKAIDVISYNFLFGTGVQSTTDMRNVFQYAQLHNTLLNTLLWGGFIGIGLYCIFIYSIHRDCKKLMKKNVSKVMTFLFIAVMVSSLMDGIELASGIYLFYFVISNYGYFRRIVKNKE